MSTFKITNDMIKNGTFDPSLIPEGTTRVDLEGCTSLTSLEGVTFEGTANLRGCAG